MKPLLWERMLLLIGALTLCCVRSSVAIADTAPGDVKISGAAAAIQAANNTGDDYQLQIEYRLSKENLIYAGAEQTTRIYNGVPPLTDNSLSAGHIAVLMPRLYLEDRITYAPNANFLPYFSAQTVPHWVLPNGAEVSLGFKFSQYTGENVGTLSPGLLWTFTDALIASAQLNIIDTYHYIYSEQGFVQYSFNERHRVRVTGATGRAIEGIDLEGQFTSVAVGYRWTIIPTVDLEPNVSVYRGSVRNENAVGLNFAWTIK